jgi:hypothetical protein
VELQAIPTQPGTILPGASARGFPPTSADGTLPNITLPASASASHLQHSLRQRTHTPPPLPSRQATSPTSSKTVSRVPQGEEKSRRRRSSQMSPNPTKAGAEAANRVSTASVGSYHGTDSDNSSLQDLGRSKPYVLVRDSLVLAPSQFSRDEETSKAELSREGDVRPATAQTARLSESGFGDWDPKDGRYINRLSPLPSMPGGSSARRSPPGTRTSTSSDFGRAEVAGYFEAEQPPSPSRTRRDAGLTAPGRVQTKSPAAKRESGVFSLHQPRPNISSK